CSYKSSSHLRSGRIVRGCGGEFLPATKGSESVEIEDGDAMHDGMTHLQHALEADQRLIIDFIFAQQLGVITEVAQEPGQLPHCSGPAVEAAGDQASGEMLGLKNSEADLVIRFLCMPAILHSIHPGEEYSIRDGVDGRPIGRTEALEIAPHAAPSFGGK